MKKNYVAIVLDDSYSMQNISLWAQSAFNEIISEVKSQAAKSGQKTSVSLMKFGSSVRVEVYNSSSDSLRAMTDYRPRQDTTRLCDGVGKAIEVISDVAKHELGDVSFLVLVVTDGGENSSLVYSANRLADLIATKQKTDRWTFTFQVPPNHASTLANRLGIPIGNIREWEQTEVGTRDVGRTSSMGVTNYFTARSAGETKTNSFYANTDLSNVSTKTIAKKLDDISDHFKKFEVRNEEAVKDFVERRTRKPYIIGSAYYLLIKNEKVQPQKRVLIMEKGKKAVWGGQEARDLIGLPRGVEAKVQPGNHANYDIYVQSITTNHKLPRGTKVLVDTATVAHLPPLPPTWGTLAGVTA